MTIDHVDAAKFYSLFASEAWYWNIISMFYILQKIKVKTIAHLCISSLKVYTGWGEKSEDIRRTARIRLAEFYSFVFTFNVLLIETMLSSYCKRYITFLYNEGVMLFMYLSTLCAGFEIMNSYTVYRLIVHSVSVPFNKIVSVKFYCVSK